jgi:glycosyltransferase involved in cell wall biosynthesis
MKRILHVLAQKPGKTGSGIFLNSIIEQAAKNNYSQAVIAGISAKDDFFFPKIEERYHYPVHFDTEELPFPVVGMSDVMPYSSTKYSEMDPEMIIKWHDAFTDRIITALDQFKPDLIFSHHLWLLTSLTRKLAGDIPVIVICHGTGLRQLESASNLKARVIENCRNVDLVLTLNDFQKKSVQKQYKIPGAKIVVTGCGYNSNIFFPSATKSRKKNLKLVYCGKLSNAKGVPHLIMVFNRLLKVHDNLQLLLIGSGSGAEEKHIRQLAAQNDDKITFTGEVPQQEVGKLFRQCDIFILPSFYEGFGLVVLEALASGLHVVSTDIPGLKHWLGEKINNSGKIEYIELPRLHNTDQPWPEDIPPFEAKLEQAILNLIDKIRKNYFVDCIPEITCKSWQQWFLNVEKYL